MNEQPMNSEMTQKKEEWPRSVNVYIHREKEANFQTAEKIGLSDEATDTFKYALSEVTVTLKISEDGSYEIIKFTE